MRMFFTALSVLFSCVLSYGYTESEYLDVAREMIRHARTEDSDNLMQGTVPIGFAGFMTTNAFFCMSVDGLAGSPSDRQTAFDVYLNHMASMNGSPLRTVEDEELAMLAVDQCARMGYTNEIASLRRFSVGIEGSARHLAIASVVRLGGLGDEDLDYVLQIGTNDVMFSQRERNAAWRELARCLKARRDANLLRSSQCEQLARLIYGLHIEDWPGAVSIDEILCICNESYGSSSNRLDTIRRVLARPGLPTRLNAYFGDITNQLHQAAQPLPEVEGL